MWLLGKEGRRLVCVEGAESALSALWMIEENLAEWGCCGPLCTLTPWFLQDGARVYKAQGWLWVLWIQQQTKPTISSTHKADFLLQGQQTVNKFFLGHPVIHATMRVEVSCAILLEQVGESLPLFKDEALVRTLLSDYPQTGFSSIRWQRPLSLQLQTWAPPRDL